jgi:hypothetical protein
MPVQAVLTAYFDGEKNAGLMLAAIGIAVLGAGSVLLPARWELRAFAMTLLVLGVVEIAIGVGLYLKTGPQVERLVSLLATDGAAFTASESPRMQIVQRNFVVLEAFWLVLMTASAAVALWQKRNPTWNGIALGVLINASVFLAFDIIAERRGNRYLAALVEGER